MKFFAHNNKDFEVDILLHYKKYWQKIFLSEETSEFWKKNISLGRVNLTNLDSFLKDYGTIKGIYAPTDNGGLDGLAKAYKKYIDSLSAEALKNFSKELSDYATHYYTMWKNYNNCEDFRILDRLNSTLLILDKLEITTFNPYILKLVKEDDKEKDEKLFQLQRFVLKRFLWKASTNNYNKCCLEVLKYDNPSKYLNDYNEQTNIDWTEYPQQIKNLRNTQETLLLFLVEMIRRNINGEGKYCDNFNYNKSLEHIMPQKWQEYWHSVPSFKLDTNGDFVEVFDDEKEINRKSKIASLGNMALLTNKLNTSISNSNFSIKIDGKNDKKGIRCFVGTLSVTNEIVQRYDSNHKWDEKDIIEREKFLFNELNDFYKFGKKIGIDTENKFVNNILVNNFYFNDDYFKDNKIGVIAREAFSFLIKNNLLTDEEIALLKTKEYSHEIFGARMPIFELDQNNILDGQGNRRYYKETLPSNPPMYLYHDWFDKNKEKLIRWIKPRVYRKLDSNKK